MGSPERRGDDAAEVAGPSSALWVDSLAGVYRSTTDGRVLVCNAAFASIFGYPSIEALKAEPAQALYVDPSDRAGNLERLRQAGAIHSGEMRMRRLDGSPIRVIYTERMVRRGAEELIEGTLIDVTARHEAERALQQASRLAAVGALAAGVVHDVNNPLASMRANAQFAREIVARLAASLKPGADRDELLEAQAALAETEEAAARVSDTLRRLHPYASMPAPQLETLDLRAVLDRALALAAQVLNGRAQVVRRYEPAPPVIADERGLVQAFLEIIAQAASVLPLGPEARHRITVMVEPVPGGVRATVADDGPGIEPQALTRHFDTSLPPGTGGGLTAARALFLEAEAEMNVESMGGHGTSVTVRFQATVPAAP